MTTLRLLLAGVLGALSLVVLTATPSFACSCAMASTQEYVDGATVVFTGTVTDTEPPPKRPVMSSMDPVTYTFDVERAFKGDVSGPLPVLSAESGASCGLEGVEVGQRYVVFASESKRGDSIVNGFVERPVVVGIEVLTRVHFLLDDEEQFLEPRHPVDRLGPATARRVEQQHHQVPHRRPWSRRGSNSKFHLLPLERGFDVLTTQRVIGMPEVSCPLFQRVELLLIHFQVQLR